MFVIVLCTVCIVLVLLIIYSITTGFDIVECFRNIKARFSRNKDSNSTENCAGSFKYKVLGEKNVRSPKINLLSPDIGKSSDSAFTSAQPTPQRKTAYAKRSMKFRNENVSDNSQREKGFPFKSPSLKRSSGVTKFKYQIIN